MIQKKHCSFPDIGQYRNVVKTIQERTKYVGKDEDGKPIYDHTRPMPKLTFIGTVKLHGSNAGVTFTKDNQYWAQSRENIITTESDNAGFAQFVEDNIESFKKLIEKINFGDSDYITIFGEWCGHGIQKGVAITKLPKMFVVFDVKFSYYDEIGSNNFYAYEELVRSIKDPDHQIYNIYDFKTYEIEIDFEKPEMFQNKLIEMVNEVEAKCPVGESFGIDGVGEGIVFRYQDDHGLTYRWKSKGEKHSVTKVKTLVPVDTEKMESIYEFVEYSVTENRLNQACEKIFGINGELDITKTGDFVRWVVNDIYKEESDTLSDNNITQKDVNPLISKKASRWLMNKINSTF